MKCETLSKCDEIVRSGFAPHPLFVCSDVEVGLCGFWPSSIQTDCQNSALGRWDGDCELSIWIRVFQKLPDSWRASLPSLGADIWHHKFRKTSICWCMRGIRTLVDWWCWLFCSSLFWPICLFMISKDRFQAADFDLDFYSFRLPSNRLASELKVAWLTIVVVNIFSILSDSF